MKRQMRNPLEQTPSGTSREFGAVIRRLPDAHWDPLLVCVALFTLTSLGRIHQLFPVLLPLRPTLVAGALAILLYLIDPSHARRMSAIRCRTTTFVLTLLLWVALSVPGSLWPGGSFQLLTDDFLKTVLMYLVIVGAVRGLRDLERLSFVYFAAAAIFAATGLALFGAKAGGRLDHMPYYDANDFGVFAVTALPLGLYFIFGQSRLVLRLAACAGLVPLLLAFVRAGSRGGFIALIAVTAFFLVRQTTIPTRWRVLGVVVIGVLVGVSSSHGYWERMGTILHTQEDYNLTSQTGRWQIWGRGLGYMLGNPLLGVGAGSFSTAEGRISGIKDWTAPHNAYVQLGAELGIPGLLFFLGLIASALATLRAVEPAHTQSGAPVGRPPRLAQALTAALIGYAVGAFFLSLAYAGMLWTLAALAVGLGKVTGIVIQFQMGRPPRIRSLPLWPQAVGPDPERNPW
jgi:O-antigen ligase